MWTILLAIVCSALGADGVSAKEVSGEWRYVEMTVDLKATKLRVVRDQSGAFLNDLIPKGAMAAINGGYFDDKFKPTGWLVDDAREYAKRVESKKGGVLYVKNKEAFLSRMATSDREPEFALQNGPFLIEPDGNIGIRSDDGKRAARTIACVDGKHEHGIRRGKLRWILIFSSPNGAPTLMESAKFLKEKLSCSSALNLDGGPSTGYWALPKFKLSGSLPIVPIGYGVAMVPR